MHKKLRLLYKCRPKINKKQGMRHKGLWRMRAERWIACGDPCRGHQTKVLLPHFVRHFLFPFALPGKPGTLPEIKNAPCGAAKLLFAGCRLQLSNRFVADMNKIVDFLNRYLLNSQTAK
jgi:hypothetical protein